jgi:hypothetical protein
MFPAELFMCIVMQTVTLVHGLLQLQAMVARTAPYVIWAPTAGAAAKTPASSVILAQAPQSRAQQARNNARCGQLNDKWYTAAI